MNVQEIKATVEKKKAMLEAPENAWPLPPDVATWETADEAALKAETKELLAHAAAQDAAREKAAARSAEIEKELAALKEEAAKLEAEVAAEEKHLGDAMDRADELTAVTAGAAATALVAGPGGPGGDETQALERAAMRKKRTAEVADLVAGNQEHAEAAEYFSAMTECCEVLGGVKILSCDEVPVDSPLKALTASAAAATSEEEAAKNCSQSQAPH